MSDFLHEEREKDSAATWALRGVLGVAVALGLWFAADRVRDAGERPPPAETHRVTLVDEPPPPPPEDIPEPEPMEFEETQIVEAETPPEDSGPDLDQLGVIGDGVAGGDAFGLRSRQNGIDAFQALRDGGGGNGFAWRLWSDEVGNALRADLQRYPELRRINYRVKLEVRFDDGGAVTRCRLVDSTGDEAVDALIERRCASLEVSGPPPQGLPQPLRLAVNVYGAR